MLTLERAVKDGRLQDFIDQAEARLKELDLDHPDADEVENNLASAITERQSKGRTWRSPSGDGSSGT